MIHIESLMPNGRWRVTAFGSGAVRRGKGFGRTREEARMRARIDARAFDGDSQRSAPGSQTDPSHIELTTPVGSLANADDQYRFDETVDSARFLR